MTRLLLACWLVLATVSPAWPQSWPQPPSGLRLDGGGGSVAVTFNATGTSGRETSKSSPQTIAITVAAGSDLIMLVGISHSGPFDGITISGVSSSVDGAFTVVPSSGITKGAIRTEIWRLLNPTVGAHTISVTWASGTISVITSGAVAANDADVGGTPLGTASTASGTTQAASVSPASASGELAFAVTGVDNSGSPTLAVTAGTQRWITTSSATQEAGGSTIDGAGPTVTLSWSITGAGNQDWAASGVSVKAAAGGGRTTKNTRAWPLGVEVGMGWRMPL